MQPRDQDLAVLHGLGITIRIPPLLNEFEAEQNLERRVQILRRTRQGHIWDPREPEDAPESDHPAPRDPGDDDQPNDPRRMRFPLWHVNFLLFQHLRRPRCLTAILHPTPQGLLPLVLPVHLAQTGEGLWFSLWMVFPSLLFYLGMITICFLITLPLPFRLIDKTSWDFRWFSIAPLTYVQVGLHCILLQRRFEFPPVSICSIGFGRCWASCCPRGPAHALQAFTSLGSLCHRSGLTTTRFWTFFSLWGSRQSLSGLAQQHRDWCDRCWTIASFRWGLHQDFHWCFWWSWCLSLRRGHWREWELKWCSFGRHRGWAYWSISKLASQACWCMFSFSTVCRANYLEDSSGPCPCTQVTTGIRSSCATRSSSETSAGFSPRGSFWSWTTLWPGLHDWVWRGG